MKTMKYKVLAADDEFWSRENIRNLIPWEEYSLEFLEPACDGEEVMERIEEEKPDIILTDINMPFLSGLELLERLQKEYPEIITVAISGYDDFDKVKGVFVSGGLDYLLKPVGKEEMVKVLTKALNLLEEREGGIPFSVSLPKAPVSIHADAMTTEELHQKLEKGYNDIAAGRVQNAAEAFAKFRENH